MPSLEAADIERTMLEKPFSAADPRTMRVSPKLVKARFLGNLAWWVILILACVALHVLTAVFSWPWWVHLCAIPVYIFVAQSILFIPRRARALGYLTRENDIAFREGILFRSVTILPYGRIQDININEGPIERAYGLSTITLKTAGGALVDVSIPGLERREAERIRDLVTREAHEKMAAL